MNEQAIAFRMYQIRKRIEEIHERPGEYTEMYIEEIYRQRRELLDQYYAQFFDNVRVL